MFKKLAKKLLNIAIDRPLPPASSDEKVFLSELQNTFRGMPVFETGNALPSEQAWLGNMNRLRELVLTEDPREFLRWDVVRGTMFVGNARYISTELKYLKQHPDWDTRWRTAIRETSVGHPSPYIFYPASSGNLIHHAYHLAKFEEQTGRKIHELDFVLEFGGGYGGMCRLLHKLGFKGRYVIFDLPSFSALQTYFLKTLGLAVMPGTRLREASAGVACVSDVQDLKAILSSEATRNSLFIATWSISESPLSVRESILPLISGFDSFLIAFQDGFGEMNNVEFFERWKDTLRNVTWHGWPIEHIPGSRYLVGDRSK